MRLRRFANTRDILNLFDIGLWKKNIPHHGLNSFVWDTEAKMLIVEGEFENTFPPTLIHYYVAFRAYDKYLQVYSQPPGKSEDVADDLATMTSFVSEILNESPSN